MNVTTKTAIVTGASRGLGKQMALALAKKGIDVIFTYNNNKEAAEQVVSEIQSLGRKAKAFQLDTRKVTQFDDFITQITQYLKKETGSPNFDFLINNAGTGLYVPVQEVTEEQLDDTFNIHYKGVFFLTQKALPFLNVGGGIVNISTGLSRFVSPNYAVYASMKGAVEVLTRYLAVELGARKINVNTVAPGAIETDFNGGAVRDNEDLNAHIASTIALGRVGLPEDIGNVVAFLCTDQAHWINAQRIEVSGGQALK
ncbi:MAG: SDR family NAD(P)-dependent oxidoreductase [Sphingobacterium sp.]